MPAKKPATAPSGSATRRTDIDCGSTTNHRSRCPGAHGTTSSRSNRRCRLSHAGADLAGLAEDQHAPPGSRRDVFIVRDYNDYHIVRVDSSAGRSVWLVVLVAWDAGTEHEGEVVAWFLTYDEASRFVEKKGFLQPEDVTIEDARAMRG